MSILVRVLAIALSILLPVGVLAKADKIKTAMLETFPSAEKSKALVFAGDDLLKSTLRGIVVVKKGGIAAERAPFYLGWEDYDYRGVDVNFAKGGELKTRRGAVYTYLQPGDVLAVSSISYLANTISLKLITPDVYVPEQRRADRRHSRVTVQLNFTFPSDVIKSDDEKAVIASISEWLEPFKSLDEATAFGKTLRPEGYITPSAVAPVKKPRKNEPEMTEADRIESLEKKIEAAKKQIDEASKEMESLKTR